MKMETKMETIKLKKDSSYDGLYEDNSGCLWSFTHADPFANSDLLCTNCGETVTSSEDAYMCLDGGDVAHIYCVEVKE